LCACGKSERQKQAEREAADAQWEASLAKAEAERQKDEQALVKAELAQIAARDGSSTASGSGSRTGARPPQSRELQRLKDSMIVNVRSSLPHPETAKFQGARMNTTHDAVCGEVDFEYWPNGSPTRSGYKRFVAQISHYRNSGFDSDEGSGIAYHTAVDIDYQNRDKYFSELSAKVNCSPDPDY